MSAIAGIIRFDGGTVDPDLVKGMTDWMSPRGPDGIRHWISPSAVIGHCLFRTTPESLEETQPLLSDDQSLLLVMDGRVDNWEELRAELLSKGVSLRTRSDSELVLRAFELWGDSCLDHIDGDFALVIWDANRRRAFCARDRFGVKPFYYHYDGKIFSFATEVRPLLDLPWVQRAFNEGIAAEFLGAEWSSVDETFWQAIFRLPPSTRMIIDAGDRNVEGYWHPDVSVHHPPLSDAEYVIRYRELLTDAVRRMSRSQRPIACEVSGGLDSSGVFVLAEQLRRDGKFPAPGLQGYTLHFDPDSTANDLPYARAIGRKLEVAIEEVEPTELPLSCSIEKCSGDLEFPAFPNAMMAYAIREQATRAGCRVLLGGNGGDEQLVSTNTYYAEAVRSGDVRSLAGFLKEDGRSSGWSNATYLFLRHGVYPVLPAPVRKTVRAVLRARMPAGRYYWHRLLTKHTNEVLSARPPGWDSVDRQLAALIDKNDALRLLLLPYSIFCVERESSSAERQGVELRHPFLWRPLAEFLLGLPARQKMRGSLDKYIHRQALADLLPDEVLQRRDKADFTLTFARYIPSLLDYLTARGERAPVPWIKPGALATLQRDAGKPEYGGWPQFMLWTIFGCTCLKALEKDRA